MKSVVIAGSGAVASELTSYIEDHNKHVNETETIQIRGYIDYEHNIEKYWKSYQFKAPVIADIESYVPLPGEEVILGVSDINFRNFLIEEFKKKKIRIGSFIHHSVIMPQHMEIGEGNIIYPFCIIGSNVKIGCFNMVTSYSFISHDCMIGNGNFFSTTGIAGHVTIGDNNFFGIRSTVIPQITIGNRNIIQASMLIDKNVGNDSVVFYRYKEKIIAVPKGDKS
ncbi:MAG TPA: hypothetical protein VIJ95_06150 [Hanamia sp.]